MIDVNVEAWGHKDGYLTVDYREYLNDRGDLSDDLTDSLHTYMDDNGFRYPTEQAVEEWAKWQEYGRLWSEAEYGDYEFPMPVDHADLKVTGLCGEDGPWSVSSQGDNIMSDNIGLAILHCGFLDVFVVTSIEYHMDSQPDVYTMAVMDDAVMVYWNHAYGECINGHQWDTLDGGYTLTSDDHWNVCPKLTDQVRVPFGDRTKGYVACPDCGKALRLMV